MKKIKYLIKFVSCKERADSLLNGDLYMNAVGQFHLKNGIYEKDRADLREGSISHEHAIRKVDNYYIYCMSIVYENDVIDGKIRFQNKIISAFGCEKGYAVVINYDSFISTIKTIDTQYAKTYGPVDYKSLKTSTKNFEYFFIEKTVDHLFFKNPTLSYQQEFRIVIHESAPLIKETKTINGITTEVFIGYKSKTYKIKDSIKSFSKSYSIKKLKQDENYIYIEL